MLIICDIDGTIANFEKRAKKAGTAPSREDRPAFQAWLDRVQNNKTLAKDEPISEVVNCVNALHESGYKIVFLTGRSDIFRNVTMRWLMQNTNITSPILHMRTDGDWRSAAHYKESKIRAILKEHKGSILAIDDDYDNDTTHVYAKYGIKHLKVMNHG